MAGVLFRERSKKFEIIDPQRRWPSKDEHGDWRDATTGQGRCGATRAGRDQEGWNPKAFGGILDSWHPELFENKLLVFKSLRFFFFFFLCFCLFWSLCICICICACVYVCLCVYNLCVYLRAFETHSTVGIILLHSYPPFLAVLLWPFLNHCGVYSFCPSSTLLFSSGDRSHYSDYMGPMTLLLLSQPLTRPQPWWSVQGEHAVRRHSHSLDISNVNWQESTSLQSQSPWFVNTKMLTDIGRSLSEQGSKARGGEVERQRNEW